MLPELQEKLKSIIERTLKGSNLFNVPIPSIEIEIPADKVNGEFSCNIALKSAKLLKNPPIKIAEDLLKMINEAIDRSPIKNQILKIEVKAPGFINFYITNEALFEVLDQVFKETKRYGSSRHGKPKRIQVEFISANPTGPLSLAHARQAAVGDSLVNIFSFLGNDARREYYVNDAGNQIYLLGQSIKCRAQESFGVKSQIPDNGYHGEYVKDIASKLIEDHKIRDKEQLNKLDDMKFSLFGSTFILKQIKEELKDFGIKFDYWAHESKVATKKAISSVLDLLKEKDLAYESEGALWFKSTEFGDDKDRVLRKSDGSYTYLTPDIVYHRDKFKRGFSKVIDILGPDHHGYINRIKAAVEALGKSKEDLDVLIVQLASIYRDGRAISMSTRKGEYISMKEVVDEVGIDAARFYFLMRRVSSHLEFDLELAKKESSDNPVYYVQYAHARVNSLNKKAAESRSSIKTNRFSLLKTEEEIDLIKRIASFNDVLVNCSQQLDPYSLVDYLLGLATDFHKFYDRHKVLGEDSKLSSERLGLVNAVKIVLANGLKLLGINAPERM